MVMTDIDYAEDRVGNDPTDECTEMTCLKAEH